MDIGEPLLGGELDDALQRTGLAALQGTIQLLRLGDGSGLGGVSLVWKQPDREGRTVAHCPAASLPPLLRQSEGWAAFLPAIFRIQMTARSPSSERSP